MIQEPAMMDSAQEQPAGDESVEVVEERAAGPAEPGRERACPAGGGTGGFGALRRWGFVLAMLCMGFSWFAVAQEAEPWSVKEGTESGRYNIQRAVLQNSNNGFHFQLSPGVGMEEQWEDPGLAFYTVCWGFVKRAVGLGDLVPPKDLYRVEFVIVMCFFLLVYCKPLFNLPRWYWFVPPAFFVLAVQKFYPHLPDALLYLSVSTHWVKVPAALLATTITFQVWLWARAWLEEGKRFLTPGRIVRLVVYGFLVGVLASIRKDIWVTSMVAVLAASLLICLAFFLRRRNSSVLDGASWKSGLLPLAVFLLVFVGLKLVPVAMEGVWAVRDGRYTMQSNANNAGHPTWHVLYIALGAVPNELGIKWDDNVGREHIQRIPGNENIAYGSKEYERAAKKMFLGSPSANIPNCLSGASCSASASWRASKCLLCLAGLAAALAVLLLGAGYSSYGAHHGDQHFGGNRRFRSGPCLAFLLPWTSCRLMSLPC